MNTHLSRLKSALPILLPLFAALLLWSWLLGVALSPVGKTYPGFRVDAGASLWYTNEAELPGIKAGLRAGDHLQKLDGEPIPDGAALRARVAAIAPGTPLRLEGMRGHDRVAVRVVAQPFGALDFLAAFGVRFALSLAMLLIGAGAVLMRPTNLAARANFVFCLGWCVWGVTDIDMEWSNRLHPAVYYAAIALYPAGALSMALNFPETPTWLLGQRNRQAAPYVAGVGVFAAIASVFAWWGVGRAAIDVGEMVAGLWANSILLAGLLIFIRRLRRAEHPPARAQIQVILLGVAGAFLPAALLNNLPQLLTGSAPPPWVTSLTTALFVLFPLAIAYAIVRHGLFDISVIIKRTTVYTALTVLLVAGYFGTAAAIRFMATQLGFSQTSDWENALATAIIAVASFPVRAAITELVDRTFFRTAYDFREVVNRVTTQAQTTLDLDTMRRQFLDAIAEALHPRFIYILTLDAAGKSLVAEGPSALAGEASQLGLQVFLDDPLFTHDRDTAQGEEVQYVPGTGLTGLISPLAALGTHYRVPLQVGEEVVGLVVLGPKRSDEAYSTEDRELLAATRLPLATAIKTASLVDDRLFKDRVEQDLKRAREVQEAMLPRTTPVLAGYDFASSSVPCFEASGDYYDYVELGDGRLGLAVADVAGKGIAAALATAMIKSGLYNQTQTDADVLPVLTALNRLMHAVTRSAAAKSFTTCVYAVLEPETRILSYACAGHLPPLHWRAQAGRVAEYPMVGGFPLGVRDSARYVSQKMHLAPGDVVVLYSDGVTEAQAPLDLAQGGPIEPGEQFESERLAKVVGAHAHESAQAIHDAVLNAVTQFLGGHPNGDDVTLVVLKVAP